MLKQLVDRLRRLRLQHLLFLLLMVTGMIPLAISSSVLILMNRELLTTQEKSYLTRSSESLSQSLDSYFTNARSLLTLTGEALVAEGGGDRFEDRLREPWVAPFLEEALKTQPGLRALRILDASGVGPFFGAADLPAEVSAGMDHAFAEVRRLGEPVYDLVVPKDNMPLALIAVPVGGSTGAPKLIVEGVARLPMSELLSREAMGEPTVFLIDRDGQVLWSEGADQGMREALANSDLARDFASRPLSLTREYELPLGGEMKTVQGRVSPVRETGWGVVVQRPLALAFTDVRQMIWNAALSTGLLLILAFLIAIFAARSGSQPFNRLAETSHEIAAGNFGRRVDASRGFGLEVLTLARDFNLMSGHVEKYVDELRQAAHANRELFIGSIRAFSAAIDAKDPYTLGHSERVAQNSRTIGEYLQLSPELRQRIWLSAVLHDVGKIGIADSILQKVGKLTDDEYDIMKQHPVIGEEILCSIDQLSEALPGIRSHHESWDGGGYPDGLTGESIPLLARIVTVADTFDAMTTHRPYSSGYSQEYAAQTITGLTGIRYDARIVAAFMKAFEDGAIVGTRQHLAVEGKSDPTTSETVG